MMRVGVIGAGFISRVYFAALATSRDAELVAVADTDPHARERAPDVSTAHLFDVERGKQEASKIADSINVE